MTITNFVLRKAHNTPHFLVRYFCDSPTRYSGYILHFDNQEQYGFATRNDQPQNAYHFNASDLHCEGVAKVRPHQKVEFSIIETPNNRYFARDVTAPEGYLLSYRQTNMRLPKERRYLKLRDLDENRRWTGIVTLINEERKQGMIIPDEVGYENLHFDFHDLHCTGIKKIKEFSEVEFNVVERQKGIDRAIAITMPGGNPITYENRRWGTIRRQLGMRYSRLDVKAKIQKRDAPREQGFICEYNQDRCFGYICPFNSPFTRVFIHLDDCHMAGNRELRIMQEVEFHAEDQPGEPFRRALDVTAPNEGVLKWDQDNYLLPKSRRDNELPADTKQRFSGIVAAVFNNSEEKKDFWGIIVPDILGSKDLYFHKGGVVGTDNKFIERNSIVEFSVTKREDGNLRAEKITGPGNRPLTYYKGTIGEFFRGHNIALSECTPVPISNQRLQGFVVRWFPHNDTGLIEITSLPRRHERVVLETRYVKGLRGNQVRIGAFVEFTVVNRNPGTEPSDMYTRAAIEVSSVGRSEYDPGVLYWVESQKK